MAAPEKYTVRHRLLAFTKFSLCGGDAIRRVFCATNGVASKAHSNGISCGAVHIVQLFRAS
jgi:hypothetical protein